VRLAPYRIEGPALVSFSGGRTSAYMLRMILDAHGGALPDDVHVCFANTGKEREETLRFVHECESRWSVRVNWLEFITDLASAGPGGRIEVVGSNSAARNGEPFDRLIERKQAIPSTITGRWCTDFLKVRTLQDFMRMQGHEPGAYCEVIGIRADEADRAVRLRAKDRNVARHIATPLIEAGVRKPDVLAFWAAQGFDLELPRGYGNCDHCPFVGTKNRIARARFDPAGTLWWAQHEKGRKFSFGRTFSFVEILGLTASEPPLIPDDYADAECGLWCAGEAA
jgi:3'-phosphoadenosine 5'-phosphosulfate sulfotransferase (PAPS reductase)/FAD synthetase